MSNVIQIKNGATAPTTSNLQPYELGYVRGGALYINNNGTIAQLTDPKTIGLINSSSYLKLPKVVQTTSNTGRILVADSSGVIYYKTPADIRSEIGAFPSSGGVLITTEGNWGEVDPNTINKAGTKGQLYFVLI